MFGTRLCVVLLFVYQVAGRGQDCKSEAVAGHILDQAKSKQQGSSVEVLKLYRAENELGCVTDCCSGKYGPCTVAGFNNQTHDPTSVNCYHFHCSPLTSCAFLASKETASFKVQPQGIVPSVRSTTPRPSNHTTSQVTNKGVPLNTSTTSVTRTDGVHSERPRTTPRKGVNFTEEDPQVAQGDGTFSKPRKGVQSDPQLEETLPVKNDNTGVKPRKGVEIVPSHNVTNEPSMPSEENSTSLQFSIFNRDNISTSIISEEIGNSYNGTLHLTTPKTVSSSEIQMATIWSDISTHSSDDKMVVPPSQTLESYAPLWEDPRPSTILEYTTPQGGPTSNHLSDITTQRIATNPLQRASSTTVRPFGSPNEEDIKFSMSSMHIVIALVMGLLLLFVVLGIVGKQVYDIWLRRHYHRMDFLIDGMYDSYA